MIARLAEHSHIPADLDPDYVARHRAWIASQPGFCGGYHLLEPETGRALSLTMWEDHDALAAVEREQEAGRGPSRRAAQPREPADGPLRPSRRSLLAQPAARIRPPPKYRRRSHATRPAMATEQLRQPTHPETEPCKADRIRAESTLSRRSTTLRPGIRTRHVYSDARDARYHADARFVVPGSAHALEVRRRDAGRFLTTVLMTDIVDSTHIAARLGDWRWRAHLIEHYADCRALIADGGGELVSTTGDGIVATFDAPTRAVRAAIAIQMAARRVGIGVRAGVHTGECERLGDDLAGVAVHLTERICALAGADEVLTTGTVRDLVIGSLLAFEPRGRHALRGVPSDWTVFSATDPASSDSVDESRRLPARDVSGLEGAKAARWRGGLRSG